MGYTLIIGDYKEIIEEGYTLVCPEIITLENAPHDGSPTDYTNERRPSYTDWHTFMVETGLQPLFNSRNGMLMNNENHPGYVILNKNHQRIIHMTYRNINLIPKNQRGRLEWLKFWVDWALENCRKPVFVNS